MSTANTNLVSNKKSKFTRGEKCIFIHLIITFSLIITLIIVYFMHLCLVSHNGNDYYRITRRFTKKSQMDEVSMYLSIGMAYLNAKPSQMICNTLLLKQQWSIVPAHCVLVRSNPNLAYLLSYWKIKYRTILSDLVETDIKYGVVHSYFNNDDLENNIGLFKHSTPIYTREYKYNNINTEQSDDALMAGWDIRRSIEQQHKYIVCEIFNCLATTRYSLVTDRQRFCPRCHKYMEYNINTVTLLKKRSCSQAVQPIIDKARGTEFCVVNNNTKKILKPDIGAMILINSEIVGFFSWGDRNGNSVPLVILRIAPFKDWLEFATSL